MQEGPPDTLTQKLPLTTVILAMSADGKISDRGRSPARFGSAADQAHLEEQVSLVDAVIFGAGTLRAYGTTMSVRSPQLLAQRQVRGQSPQPVQIVCSASGDLDPKVRFFSQPVPRWLLTTAAGAQQWDGCDGFETVWVAPQRQEGMDWQEIWRSLSGFGFERVAVLGGGALAAAVFEAGLVQEFWLTVCPLVLGGAAAPTPVDGLGVLAEVAPRLRLRSLEQRGDEVFLHYGVLHDEAISGEK